jgi:tetratricopeptide (TPR) repeat protein
MQVKESNLITKHAGFAACFLLCILTLIPYWQVRHFPFVCYDDNVYVTSNPDVQAGLTAKGIVRSFSLTGYASNWHPLTWMSHMADVQLFGMNPGPQHLTNLLLHIVNTLLLFGVLRAMTASGWKSFFVAALFALHPMHVESVAWISERKDVLSALFWFLTLWCYLWYVRQRSFARYALVIIAFVLGLLAKPMLVTLPFVLLLLDFWPLRRMKIGRRGEEKRGRMTGTGDRNLQPPSQSGFRVETCSFQSLLLEKAPLFLLSAGSSIVTFIAQKKGGALEPLETLPFASRLTNGITSYGAYIWKMVAPYNLTCLYPHPFRIMWPGFILSLLFLGSVTALSLKSLWRMPYMAAGWFWYLVSLVPVIGFVQVGLQSMADRYTYIPYIGIFIMVAWGIPELMQHVPRRVEILSTAAALVLLVMMMVARAQTAYWRESIPLFEHALDVAALRDIDAQNSTALRVQTPAEKAIIHNLSSAYSNFGFLLAQENRTKEAILYYQKALRVYPSHLRALDNLETALEKEGRSQEAVPFYLEALRLNPDDFDAHCNFGDILLKQGKAEEAVLHFEQALRINPRSFATHNTLGVTLAEEGRMDEAVGHFVVAVNIKPDDVGARNNLGHALVEQGKLDEAEVQFLEGLRIKPDNVDALSNLGLVYAKQGRLNDAIRQFKEALRINPDYVPARQNLNVALGRANSAK